MKLMHINEYEVASLSVAIFIETNKDPLQIKINIMLLFSSLANVSIRCSVQIVTKVICRESSFFFNPWP